MAADSKGQAVGWDEPPVDKPNEGGEFSLLPEGRYPFRVKKLERGRYDGGPNMCACPIAILYCEIDGGEMGTTTIKNNMHLNTIVQGIHAAFFACIGLRKHKEPLVYAWDKVPGSSGWCKVGIREYEKNGEKRKINEIKAWLDAPASAITKAPAAAPVNPDAEPWDDGREDGLLD